MRLTENELSIMEVLWTSDKPLHTAGIIDLCVDKQWKSSSIHILINSLLDKGAIVVDGFEKVGRTYSRTFSPAISKESYMVNSLIDNVQLNDSIIREMTLALIRDDNISKETMDILEQLIKEKKSKCEHE